jgi:HSP20 family protein
MANENENMDQMESGGAEARPVRRGEVPFRDTLDRFFDEELWDPAQFFRGSRLRSFGRVFPRIDVRETDTMVKVVADVPGVNPDNISIDVIGNRMTISGIMNEENSQGEKSFRNERIYGEFRREFTLPARVKEQEIKAVHKEGILTITMPKRDEEIRKKIPIERQ